MEKGTNKGVQERRNIETRQRTNYAKGTNESAVKEKVPGESRTQMKEEEGEAKEEPGRGREEKREKEEN